MSTASPNMNLVVSTVGVDSGLLWEQNLNADLLILDGHNHTSGKGVQIPPSGLNINASLPFNGQQAIGLQAAVFIAQSSFGTQFSIYFSGVDLYANDGAGNTIRLTSGGTVNATSSGISSGTATASFSTGVLIVNSASTTPANIKCGSVLLGNNVAGSHYLTLSPPSAMAADFTLTLPQVPVSTSLMTLDSSGNMATTTFPLPQAGLASNSVGTSQLIANSVTPAKLQALNILSSSFGPAGIPTSVGNPWYAASGNSVTLTAGTWRLTGTVNWTTTTNAVGDLRFGFFGANGNDTSTTPTSLSVASQSSGVLGEIRCFSSSSGTNSLNFFSAAPDTIVTVSGSTTVYLDMFHGLATGSGVQYRGTISAEQLR